MAIVVYVVGIPLLLLILLCVNQRRGTLKYPAIEFDGNGVIEPIHVNAAVKRLNEYFRNRVAFASTSSWAFATQNVSCAERGWTTMMECVASTVSFLYAHNLTRSPSHI